MNVHPAAEIFPLDAATIPELAESIKANGLIEPVELYRGDVIDGRRRLAACKLAGVAVRTVDVNPPDPIAYSWAKNGPRRHLTHEEKAMAGARMRGLYDKAAQDRIKEAGEKGSEGGRGNKKTPQARAPEGFTDSKEETATEEKPKKPAPQVRELVAKAVGVGVKAIDNATKVVKTGIPELETAVKTGKVSLTAAAKIAQEKPAEQKKMLEVKPFRAKIVPPKKPYVPPTAEDIAKIDSPEYKLESAFRLANQAINALKSIPRNHPNRTRAFDNVIEFAQAHRENF